MEEPINVPNFEIEEQIQPEPTQIQGLGEPFNVGLQMNDKPDDDETKYETKDDETKDEIIVDSNNEKMSIYYKLKQKYEDEKMIDIESIRSEKNSIKSKREKFLKLKPKCINCKRRVGTIFVNKFNEEENVRKLIATCGSVESPCILNIELLINPVHLLTDLVNDTKTKISESQDKVIRTKNDLLFGYISQDDALNIFDTLKNDIANDTVSMETNLFKLLDITHNTERDSQIKQLQQVFYENIKEYKQFILNFEKTQDITHIKNANEYYINTIMPTIKELTNFKYSLQEVTTSSIGEPIKDDTDEPKSNKIPNYSLIQKDITIDMLEDTNNKELVSVSHFKVGISSDPYSPIQPIINKKFKTKNKNKTIKKTTINKKPRQTKKKTQFEEPEEFEEP